MGKYPKGVKRKRHSAESYQRQGEKLKKKWKDPEYKEKMERRESGKRTPAQERKRVRSRKKMATERGYYWSKATLEKMSDSAKRRLHG